MKNKKILTIKIEGKTLKGLRDVVDVLYHFIEFEKDVKIKKVSLKKDTCNKKQNS